MTREFYTLPEAAARLSVSLRTVHNYLRKGMLTREIRGGKAHIPAAEVEDLKVESTFPAMTRANWIEMTSRVRRLEERMAAVCTTLGIKNDPLRPSKENATELHLQAKKASMELTWQDQEVSMWADILLRIDEVTLTTIASAVADLQPWSTYFNLCQVLIAHCEAKYKKSKTVALEAQIQKLEECRRHLRSVAVVWMETNRGSLSEVVLKAMTKASPYKRTSSEQD